MITYQQDPELGVSVHLYCWAFSLVESSSLNILPALCFRGERIILAGMAQTGEMQVLFPPSHRLPL